MSADRRDFLKTMGGAALVSAASGPLVEFVGQEVKRPRVVVLWEEGFPTIDGFNLERGALAAALGAFDTQFWGVQQFIERSEKEPPDLFVNPYGAAFPLRGWYPLHQYLWPGRNWLNLGGVPLAVPCVRTGNGWRAETRQPQYHKRFGIYQTFAVAGQNVREWRIPHPKGFEIGPGHGFGVEEVYEMYLRFTATNDYPNETGTAGQRDARLTSLLLGYNANGRCIAAPIVQIDRMLGDYAGGRWLWANYKGRISTELIKTLAEIAMQGAIEVVAQPSFACYREGETPTINVQVRRPKDDLRLFDEGSITIIPIRKSGAPAQLSPSRSGLLPTRFGLKQSSGGAIGSYTFPKTATPGFHEVWTSVEVPMGKAGNLSTIHNTTGFWVYDAKLIAGGAPITTDRHYFYRNGEPFPVTGTTYMASDVHRKFLLEPNPFVWDKDFAEMKAAGVNMVRTGLWTAWKNFMLDVGTVNEAALRALDAFMLTARKYDIPIIFTFFAFLPEMWGGKNAYLDPRAVRAQQQFLSVIAQRYGMMNDVIWDLINEPSFCNPDRLWSCRPNYDSFERQAWSDWLKSSYPAASDEEREVRLLENWRATPEDGIGLPKLEEFDGVAIHDNRRPFKTIDYKLFAQETFTRWVEAMTTALRSNGNKNQLITVGQDEAGCGDSPSPQFHAPAVDFTCLHNWWANDDLVWDGVMMKAPMKPLLVEETGIMFYEKLDGRPWRSEEEAARLLERKMALSLGANGAGFVEWIWNINPYMTLDNEATIGFNRMAGTAKPELEMFTNVARFAAANRKYFKGKVEEDAVLVIPQTNIFTPRNHATEITRRAVRVMHYHCQTPLSAVGEYQLHELNTTPKMLLVPSPMGLHSRCWDALLAHADKGATVVITGPIDLDDHYLPTERLKALNLQATRGPVMDYEFVECDKRELSLRFGGEKIQRLEKNVVNGEGTARVHVIPRGAGRIVWCPVPLEAGDENEPVAAFYNYALKLANIAPIFTTFRPNPKITEAGAFVNPSVLVRPTIFAEAALYTFASETDRDTELFVRHNEARTSFTVKVPAQRAALIFVDRKTGKLISSTLDYLRNM